jgi:hypothetical protein
MQYLGDIELINGKIINLKVDPQTGLPEFESSEESRLVYNLVDKQLYYNDGNEWRPLQVASQDAQPLIATLGDNWINPDYSFNPTPFNALQFISGLTSTDSLFTVIQKIDDALVDISSIQINDIEGFDVENPQAGDIIYFDGVHFVNVPLSEIPDFAFNIALGSLSDVDIQTVPTLNQTIFFNSETNKFQNAPWSYRYEQNTPQLTHVVNHNLNNVACQVTLIDIGVSPNVAIPASQISSIQYNNNTQLTVNLNTPKALIILVTTVPFQ